MSNEKYSNNYEVALAILEKIDGGGSGGGSTDSTIAPKTISFDGYTGEELDLSALSPVNLSELSACFRCKNLVRIKGLKNFTAENIANIKTVQNFLQMTKKLVDDGGLSSLPFKLTREMSLDSLFYECGLPFQSIANYTYQPTGSVRISGMFRGTLATKIDISNHNFYAIQQNCIANGKTWYWWYNFAESSTVKEVVCKNTTLPEEDLQLFTYCSLTPQSYRDVFSSLPVITSGKSIQISGENPLAEDIIQIAIDKGWTVSFQ